VYRFLTRLAFCCPLVLLLLPLLPSQSQQALAQQDNSACVQDPGNEVFDWSGVPTTFRGSYGPTSDPKLFDLCLKYSPAATVYVGRQGNGVDAAAFVFVLFRQGSGGSTVPTRLCYSYAGFNDDAAIRAFPQPGTATVDINVNNFTEKRVQSIVYTIETSNGLTITSTFSAFSPTLFVPSEPAPFPIESVLATAANHTFSVVSNPITNSVDGIVTDFAPRATSPCAPPASTNTPTPTLTPTSTLATGGTLTPTSTAPTATAPTATFTPTPTSTVAPIVCSPRPRVLVETAPDGPGRQRVTVTAQNDSGRSGNRIQAIAFSPEAARPMVNAVVDIGALVGESGPFTYSPPTSTTQVQFLVRRVSGPGAAAFVPFEVRDLCADAPWRTFVGLGAGAP
jgi:hypothetical protein